MLFIPCFLLFIPFLLSVFDFNVIVVCVEFCWFGFDGLALPVVFGWDGLLGW
jgi:hypothetical protein